MKKYTNKLLTAFLLLTTLLSSCERTEDWFTTGETFFLKTDEAVLPVWVVGNIESGTFMIVNHGGPGLTTGYDFHATTAFKELEKDYAIVYYDQRMAGMSKGDPDMGDLTIMHHLVDLDRLITLIKHKYSPESLFLFGHSWGGGMLVEYLGWENKSHQDIKGWIDSDGSLQDKWEMDLKKAWQLPRAQAKYEETGDSEWLEIIEWWETNPYPDEGDWAPYQFASQLGAYVYDEEAAEALNPTSKLEKHFFSPYDVMFWTDNYKDTNFIAGHDFMPHAKNIDIPTLLIWGKEDGAVPYHVADSLYSLIQTDEQHKYNVQIEECAHSPHYESPDIFVSEVSNFIEKYK